MKSKFFAIVGLMSLLTWSCGTKSDKKGVTENAVIQQEDGTLSLNMENVIMMM
jgi:hypothetical protein